MLELVSVLTALAGAQLPDGDCSDEPGACELLPAASSGDGLGSRAAMCLGDDTCRPDETPPQALQSLPRTPPAVMAAEPPLLDVTRTPLVAAIVGAILSGYFPHLLRPPNA
ncbi:MAG: hypothetical protein AABZ30_06715 [Myxococcota bacterium]